MKDEEILKIDFDNWPLPNEVLVEVGRVSALWASLESPLTLLLGKLAGFNEVNDPKPFILINHSSFPQKLDMLGALCEQLEPQYANLKGYPEVISKLKSTQAKRNRFMHNGMVFDSDSGNLEMAVGSARGKLKTKVEIVTIADIRRAVVEIDEAQTALYKLVLGRDIGPVYTRRPRKA
jgi:hypothetical protein